MILYELTGNEQHPAYQAPEISNGNRHYEFLLSIVVASLQVGRPFLSHTIIKALNWHAICCLHTNAGEYRPCDVQVGDYKPPQHYRVQALMDDFVDSVNRNWESADPVGLAALVLWRMNNIHPFINGNGRTARASSYFVLCVKLGGPIPGSPILPELIRSHRDQYIEALKSADQSFRDNGSPELAALHALLTQHLRQQLSSAQSPTTQTPPSPSPP